MSVIFEVVVDAVESLIYFIQNNLNNFANIINMLLPFVMFYVGYNSTHQSVKIVAMLWVLIPVLTGVLVYMLRHCANKIGKGTTMPMPEKRFTSVDDFGEASVDVDRVQELILYVADLEDWIERKHLK